MVLGSPVPNRLGTFTSSSFPHTYAGTWTDPTGAIILPGGWGRQSWFPFRATKGASRGEVAVFGDSTTWGSGALYSYLQRVRDQATGYTTGGPAGYGLADGGKGMAGGDIIASFGPYDSPEIMAVSATGWNPGAGTNAVPDILDTGFWWDPGEVGGRTITYQFKTTGCRLWYSQHGFMGWFTYAVDGGAPVTVQPVRPASVQGSSGYVQITGLSAGSTHTIVVTNLGHIGPLAAPVPISTGTTTSGGTLPAATTYYYVYTNVTVSGETVGSAKITTLTGAGTTNKNTINATNLSSHDVSPWFTGWNLYRASASDLSDIKFVKLVAVGGGSFTTLTDDGTVALTTGAPPGSSTAGNDFSGTECATAPAPMNATGFTTQKYARSGDTFGNRFYNQLALVAPYTQSLNGYRIHGPLGLTPTTTTSPSYAGASRDTSHDSDGGRITPVAAVLNLGFNDLTSWTDTQNNLNAFVTECVKRFAGACTDAGVDGLVCSGQLPYDANWYTLGIGMYTTLRTQTLAAGLGFVDLFYPVGGLALNYAGGTGNPHLTKSQYQAQADFLWSSLLGLA